MRCRWSSSVAISKQSVSHARKLPPPPARIMQPPPDWQTAERDYFTLTGCWSLCKNNWKEPRSILMSVQIERPYRWATHAIIVKAHNAPVRSMSLKVIKPSNPFTNVCWVFCFNNISAPPQILAASTVFFCPIPETKKWWVMVSLCYCCWLVLNKRLLSTSCNKQGQTRSSE